MSAGQASGQVPSQPPEQTLAGLAYAVLAVFFASLLLTMPRQAGSDIATFQVVLFRYVSGFVTIAPFYLTQRRRDRLATAPQTRLAPSTTWLHLLRSVLAVIRICCFVYAVTHMPFANAQAVTLTNGVFMMIFSVLILGERLNPATVVAGLVCFIGAVIAAEPSADRALIVSPSALAALAGAALWGLESTVIRYTAVRDRTERILFIVNGAAIFLIVVPAWLAWTHISLQQAAILAAMGPLAILTQVSNIRAFRAARASILAPVRYMAIVFSIALGFVLFGEWPSPIALFGMSLVALGGAVMAVLAANPALRANWLRP